MASRGAPIDGERDMGIDSVVEQARDALRRHVLAPLITHCVDQECGGFLVDLDERWRPVGPDEKSLEHAARSTIVAALLDQAFPGEGCDRLALHGCEFLQRSMWDEQYGGFFARVDRQGRPLWEGLKHPHAVTYAATAFQLCAGLLPDGVGAHWVNNALSWLDEVAWDRVHGGYWGSYRADNSPYAQGSRLPTPTTRDPLGMSPGFKEINTQSDALEAFGGCHPDAENEASGADRLEWLIALVKDRLTESDGVLPYAYRRDWRPAPFLVRTGYLFATTRRLLSLARRTENERRELVTTACRLIGFGLAAAKHPSGGFVFAVTADGRVWPESGPATDLRQWWVQFEALSALHALAHHDLAPPELRATYLAERDQQWSFIRDHYLDERRGGVYEEPDSSAGLKTHEWKDAYHETIALVALSETTDD